MGVFINGSHLLKDEEQLTRWMGVQPFLSVVPLRDWRVTHILDGCSIILISGSDPLKTGE